MGVSCCGLLVIFVTYSPPVPFFSPAIFPKNGRVKAPTIVRRFPPKKPRVADIADVDIESVGGETCTSEIRFWQLRPLRKALDMRNVPIFSAKQPGLVSSRQASCPTMGFAASLVPVITRCLTCWTYVEMNI